MAAEDGPRLSPTCSFWTTTIRASSIVAGASDHFRRAVLRCGNDADGRRSGAAFGAGADVAGGTHNSGRQARFRVPFGRRRRSVVLPSLLHLSFESCSSADVLQVALRIA